MKRLLFILIFLASISLANAVTFEGSDLRFMNIMLEDNDHSEPAFYANPGDLLIITILMDNEEGDLEDLRLTASIPELGVRSNTVTIDVEESLDHRATLFIQLPYVRGEYYVRLTAYSTEENDFWKAKHRILSII